MKILERIGLALFSTLILIISVITCLLIFGWLDTEIIFGLIEKAIETETISNVILGLCVFFILLAIKCIFFDSNSKKEIEYKNGILLENSDGKLLITKETIENLVSNIVKGFDNAENAVSRVELDKDNNVRVFINLSVKENTVIKELSTNLQTKIKTTIKDTSDLEVKEVNIKVKDMGSTQVDGIENQL